MKKNVEWLKEEVNDYLDIEGVEDARMALKAVLDYIDQLDEPETLSQEWIENHTASAYTIAHYSEEDVPVVTVYDLENLLVPKLDLPVIPDYVAEWMETVKELDADLLNAIIDGRYNVEVSEWLFIEDDEINTLNGEKLMRAWLDGYTVEEKKYYVIPPHKDSDGYKMYLTTVDDGVLDEEDLWFNTEVEKEHYSDKLFKYKFTKEEVKKIEKGAYWAFAVPVKELEE